MAALDTATAGGSDPATRPTHIYLIAGEPSGDALGARLMTALRAGDAGAVRFSGIGGPQMAEAGLASLFVYDELAVMGVFEIVPRARRLFARMRQTARDIEHCRPDAIVTIDVPAFAFGVVKRLIAHDVPRIHYGAPTIWAWRPWRVHKYRRAFDHIMALFPFEPPHFHRHDLACTFVGHAVVEGGAGGGDGAGFRARYAIDAAATVVCVLAGSRGGEVARLMPAFGGAVAELARRRPGLVAVVPTVASLLDPVHRACADWPIDAHIVTAPQERYDAMAAANVAIAASGTVGLELAMAGVPAAVAYRVAPLTAWFLRRMLMVEHASSVNLIVGRPALPELLQDDCRPTKVADALDDLLDDPARRDAVRTAQREALAALGYGGRPPSERAAGLVRAIVDDWQGARGRAVALE